MPLVQFSTANKQTKQLFPKLKLAKGETARVCALKPTPYFEWIHDLRMPEIMNGEPMMVQKQRFSGETYEDYNYEFVGRYICHGDPETVNDRGVDVDACPICAVSRAEPDYFASPNRRFAMPLLKYNLGPDGKLRDPYSADVVVWSFTERRYNELTDINEEWGSLDEHDLILGPCSNAMYQNFDIRVGQKAWWKEDEERQNLTAQIWKANQPEDLRDFTGRWIERRYMEDDIAQVRARWSEVEGDGEIASLDSLLSATQDLGDTSSAGASPGAGEEEETTDPSSPAVTQDFGQLLADL